VDFQQVDDPAGAYLNGRRVSFDSTGLDRIEFLVAPNVGEGLKPLARIASGGETSRLMLALKGVLAGADRTPTLIFDEIDQGIGGRVGTTVGYKLWALANAHQVLCITHLPQLAGFGDQHYRVEKAIRGDRTVTHVRPLTDAERTPELALMLGGTGEKTLESAAEILAYVRETKAAAARP
jgi:DNA repair protein RecN (Recombination protein N)